MPVCKGWVIRSSPVAATSAALVSDACRKRVRRAAKGEADAARREINLWGRAGRRRSSNGAALVEDQIDDGDDAAAAQAALSLELAGLARAARFLRVGSCVWRC